MRDRGGMLPKDLKEYLDVPSEDFVCSDLRVKANTWIERKRDQPSKSIQQLEAKNHQGPAPTERGSAESGQGHWEDFSTQDSQDQCGYGDKVQDKDGGKGFGPFQGYCHWCGITQRNSVSRRILA